MKTSARSACSSSPLAFPRLIWPPMGLGLLVLVGVVTLGCRPSAPDKQPSPEVQGETQSGPAQVSTSPAGWNWLPHGTQPGQSETTWPFAYRSGAADKQTTILESLGGGVGIIDYDRDGRPDLLFSGGGSLADSQVTGVPHELFRNEGDWSFVPVGDQAQISRSAHYSHGVNVADYDEDGFADVLITGYGGLQLFRNQGDGSFRRIEPSASGLTDERWSSASAWCDFNNDGILDLYVAHYVDWSFDNHPFCASSQDPAIREICSPRQFQSLDDLLYLGNGDGTFRDATASAGLLPGGKGLGVVTLDIDRDGDCDIYVANDTTNNFLYLNDGDAHFQEVGELSGVALDDRGIPNGSMGVDAGDFNRDGQFDLWVANYESEAFALYRQTRNALFTFVSHVQGIRAIESEFVGFGTLFVDVDLDGDEDLFVTNGHVILHPSLAPRRQLPLVLENQGTQYERLRWPETHVLGQPHEGRGLAQADFDGDGDPDLAYANVDESPYVIENQITPLGTPLCVSLIGTKSNRAAIGAVVELTTDQSTYVRAVKGGGSYLSTSENRLFFGIPETEVARELRVIWPSGQESRLNVEPGTRETQLVEPGP